MAAPIPTSADNYGDVALKLPADWSRSRMVGDAAFVLTTVGHECGIADAYLTESPGLRHQFTWCAPEDQNRMSTLRTKHYELCAQSTWTKNPHLWMWDGEGFIIHNGQRLMARDRVYYDQEEADNLRADEERDKKRSVSQEEENAMRRLESQGAIIEDERGRQLKPLSPR